MFQAGKVPAHIKQFLDEEKNIVDRVTVPSLSIDGKVFTVVLNGEKTPLLSRNEDGDRVPLQVFRGIVLDYNRTNGRTFYSQGYDKNKPGKPDCSSENGVVPDETIEHPVATRCDKCPNSIKGSKQNDNGQDTTACKQHRMLAVVPAAKPEFTPLRLKLPATSVYDGKDPDHEKEGWYSWTKYLDYLRSNGCTHTAAIITKMKFDTTPGISWPKLLFAPQDWVPEETKLLVAPICKSDEVKGLLSGAWTPNGVDGVDGEKVEKLTEEEKAKVPSQEELDAAVKAQAKADADAKAEKAAKAKAAREAKAEAEAKAAAEAKAEEPKAEQEKSGGAIPDDVADLLGEWGSE